MIPRPGELLAACGIGGGAFFACPESPRLRHSAKHAGQTKVTDIRSVDDNNTSFDNMFLCDSLLRFRLYPTPPFRAKLQRGASWWSPVLSAALAPARPMMSTATATAS